MNADLAAVQSEFAELKADIRASCAELKAELARMKTEVLKWVIGALTLETIVIVSALVWFVRRIVQ